MTCSCCECPHCTSVSISIGTVDNIRRLAASVEACAHGGSGGGGQPGALCFRKAKVRAALVRLNAAVALLLREVEEGGG